MTAPVFFSDTVTVVRTLLLDGLDDHGYGSVAVVSRVPNPRPTSFLRVFRTGGPRMNLVADDAQVTVEAWASTDTAAHDLLQAARGLIVAARGTVVDGTTVYRVAEVSGPAWLPDPLSDQSRYTQTFTVATRGVGSI